MNARRVCLAGALLALGATVAGQEREAPRVYFGDLHVHTTLSLDALVYGTLTRPRDAYRFARGGPLTLPGGRQVRLRRPLDFAAVTDHAFGLGEYAVCHAARSDLHAHPLCVALRGANDPAALRPLLAGRPADPPVRNTVLCGADGARCVAAGAGPWREVREAAAEFNEPGRFTTFVGYEWTPADAGRRTVHRNVIFAGETVPEQALSVFELPRVADLWAWLDRDCTAPCDVLTIPHNANFSGGLMFASTDETGAPFADADWRRRARFETVVEIMQAKGSSECAPGLGTADEECGFEQIVGPCTPGGPARCLAPHGFARDGLANGLRLRDAFGFNPMAFGFIGSTDTHTSAAGAVDEDAYTAHHAALDSTPLRALTERLPTGERIATMAPGALAAVWARENTRAALFDALRRREVYATSGPRILLSFHTADGVPMGSIVEGTDAPFFQVRAQRDPATAPLERLQVVKGWIGAGGTTRDRVWDIACGRGTPEDGRCVRVAAAPDLATCGIDAAAGRGFLEARWTDPEFDASRPAFYYVRAIEVPSCRWTTRLAHAEGLPLPEGITPTVAERAWSSPIWFAPGSERLSGGGRE